MASTPAAICAVCRRPITKAADATVTAGRIVHVVRKASHRSRSGRRVLVADNCG